MYGSQEYSAKVQSCCTKFSVPTLAICFSMLFTFIVIFLLFEVKRQELYFAFNIMLMNILSSWHSKFASFVLMIHELFCNLPSYLIPVGQKFNIEHLL